MGILLAQTSAITPSSPDEAMPMMLDLLKHNAHIFLAAFLTTLIATPLVRTLAFRIDAIDKPDFQRKAHTKPVAYMGGVAVFAGLIVAIALSFVYTRHVPVNYLNVPIAIIIGMVAIMFTGLADDLWGWDPRLKVAGQLVAAAALAIEEVGVKVATGVLVPAARFLVDGNLTAADLVFAIPVPGGVIHFDLVYWVGTAIIAIFVLGGCNAANLIDGLDGLLSGVTAFIALGLLAISLMMATQSTVDLASMDLESLSGARIILSLALLGAVLGFLPYNFNPAKIFLGDCGSLLLGYCSVVIILMLGDEGMTFLVVCGLLVFSIPIIDTILAIVRRKLAGLPLSGADDRHLHHVLKRRLGTVRKAVLALYAMGLGFALLGSSLAAIVLFTEIRARYIFIFATLFYLGVIALAFALGRRQSISANDASAGEVG